MITTLIFSPPKCSTEKRLRNILYDPGNWYLINSSPISLSWRVTTGIIALQILNCPDIKKSDYLGWIPKGSETHLTISMVKFDHCFLIITTKISNKFGKFCLSILKYFLNFNDKVTKKDFLKTFFLFFSISYARFLNNK